MYSLEIMRHQTQDALDAVGTPATATAERAERSTMSLALPLHVYGLWLGFSFDFFWLAVGTAVIPAVMYLVYCLLCDTGYNDLDHKPRMCLNFSILLPT